MRRNSFPPWLDNSLGSTKLLERRRVPLRPTDSTHIIDSVQTRSTMVFRKKKKVPAQTLAALKAANEKRAAAAAAAAAKESSAAAVDANDAGVVLMEWEVAKSIAPGNKASVDTASSDRHELDVTVLADDETVEVVSNQFTERTKAGWKTRKENANKRAALSSPKTSPTKPPRQISRVRRAVELFVAEPAINHGQSERTKAMHTKLIIAKAEEDLRVIGVKRALEEKVEVLEGIVVQLHADYTNSQEDNNHLQHSIDTWRGIEAHLHDEFKEDKDALLSQLEEMNAEVQYWKDEAKRLVDQERDFWENEAKRKEDELNELKTRYEEQLRSHFPEGEGEGESSTGGFLNITRDMPDDVKEEKLKDILNAALNKICPRNPQKKAMTLINLIVKENVFGKDSGEFALIKTARAYMRNRLPSHVILKEIDFPCNMLR